MDLDAAARGCRDGCRRRRRRRHGRRQQGRLRSCRLRQQHCLGVAHTGCCCWGAHKVDHPHRYQAEDKAYQAHAARQDAGEATGGGQAEQGVADDLLAQHVDLLLLGSGFVRLCCSGVFVGVRGRGSWRGEIQTTVWVCLVGVYGACWDTIKRRGATTTRQLLRPCPGLVWREQGSEVARRRLVERG